MYNWELAKALIEENKLVKQHIDSYNEFVDTKIYNIVNETEEITTSKEGCSIKLHKLRIEKPIVTEADGSKRVIHPNESRIRNRTYAAPLFLEMSLIMDGAEIDRQEIFIGSLPVMLRSSLCHLNGLSTEELIKKGEDPDDPGGYFIINGSERVLASLEEIAPNKLLINKTVTSGKNVVEGRITSEIGSFKAKTLIERKNDGYVYISFPTSPKKLNLFTVLYALGLDSEKKIKEAFGFEDYIENDIILNLETSAIKNQEDGLDYLGKRIAAGQSQEYRIQRAQFVLNNYLLPHVGTDQKDSLKKAHFLVRAVKKCCQVAHNKRPEDDKDHYGNKRIKIAGRLIEQLFRYAMGYFVKDVKYQIERAQTRRRKLQLKTLVRPNALTKRIRFGMATGTWPGGRQGVSQLLDRMAYLATVSHLRRIISPLSRTQPHFEARDVHPTHWGKLCPNETPEGQRCGLIKNLALGCVVSAKEPREGLEEEFIKLGVKPIKEG
jgi:DNA-directed RNA polymerase subunit B"